MNRGDWRALVARLRLRVTDIRIETEQALPRACLTLSKPLAARQPIPLADLVGLAPGADALVSGQGTELCVAGLVHGERYTLTLQNSGNGFHLRFIQRRQSGHRKAIVGRRHLGGRNALFFHWMAK